MFGLDQNLEIMLIIILVAAFAYYYYTRKIQGNTRRKTALYLREKDKQYAFIKIQSEQDNVIECAKHEGIHRRFIKDGASYSGPSGASLCIVRPGVGYTLDPDDTEKKTELPINKAVLRLIGTENYEKLPKPVKEKLEKSEWGFTVEIRKEPENEKVPKINPEAVTDIRYEVLMNFLVRAVKSAQKMSWTPYITGGAVGAFVVLLAVVMKLVKVS